MTSITSGGDREHLGIPNAVFVEDVDSFMQQPENDSADTVIRRYGDVLNNSLSILMILFLDWMI